MNPEFIDKFFINPTPALGYDTYIIRKSIMRAINDLKEKIHGNIADIGCGIMPYRSYLETSGRIDNYTGIDLENSSYHNAVVPDKYWDGEFIPLEDNSQDWVIITEFLEHYFDTAHILNEIKRVLKPGGKVFFTLPSVYMLHEVPYDHHRFTPFSLKQRFQLAGFSKADIYPLGGFNYSLIIMLGLWVRNAGGNIWLQRIVKLFLKGFSKHLIANDHFYSTYDKGHTTYENFTMPSGLWGYGYK